MTEVRGYAYVKKDAKSCVAQNTEEFLGKIVRVLEFDSNGGVLAINSKANELSIIEKEDLNSTFRCGYKNGVITPPDLNMIDEMLYLKKAMSRKGGYNDIIMKMIISASLTKGEFHDAFLWAKQ